MKKFYVLSPGEEQQCEISGETVYEAVLNGSADNWSTHMFFEEWKIEDCYVEELFDSEE
jgi:hypothetical protein